jgi:guanylate kinase
MSGKLVVITGPSGVGKSTITQEVVRRTGARFSVSATTRPPRAGEVDGREYRFVGRDEFERMIEQGDLLEWAEVFPGRFYGTPARPVQDAIVAGRTIVLDIDVQGGLQVHDKMPGATFVLVAPPDIEELKRRLLGRGTEGQAEQAARLAKAESEMAAARKSGVYDCEVVNDDLQRAIEEIVRIVQSPR